jgi:hypothetical protein
VLLLFVLTALVALRGSCGLEFFAFGIGHKAVLFVHLSLVTRQVDFLAPNIQYESLRVDPRRVLIRNYRYNRSGDKSLLTSSGKTS